MSNIRDHTGVRYGRAVGVRPTEFRQGNQVVWEWLCDCGSTFNKIAGNFVRKGYSFGCPFCVKRASKTEFGKVKIPFKEGYTPKYAKKNKEYKTWCHIKSRVSNPDDPDYQRYNSLGMYEEWKTDFSAFISEIGECPKDGKRYSVGRINNDLGYFPGNIRWETDEQQNRNRKMPCTNTSGHMGVYFKQNKGITYAVAQWRELSGKQRDRSFSVNKYGEELAILCAIEARDQAIRLLNQQGAGYSPNHGK